ncbi:MAG TPA: serine/threonine-protein kinase [Polyangiaceae bacterium]
MPSVSVPRFDLRTRIAGKYLLRRRIAVGGMGEVWVATNEATHADVALKALRRGDATRADELQMEERFRHEARLSAMLSHRSIVKVYDLIEEPDGTLLLVMELLRGDSLRRYLKKRGPRGAREAVAIISPVLSALGHAHERGIVHRDVNPSNIFLAVDPDGHVTPKLLDFGIAKLEKGAAPVETEDGRLLGTPRFLAPERIRGTREVDGRADLFSAAVVLYEMMTGVSPFAGNNPAAELAAVIERHVDPDERIDPRLWIEIRRALSKSPDERHGTAHELGAALTAAIDETQESLQEWLNQTAQVPSWNQAPAVAEEHEAIALPAKRELSSAMWPAAAALVLVGVVVAVFVAARPRTRMSTHAESAAAAVPVPTLSAGWPTPDPTTTTTTTVTATPVPTQNASSMVRPAARPRPVATTPGF